jgi:hypothetical protein
VSISDPPLGLGFQGWQYTRGGNGRSGLGWPRPRAARPGVDPRHLVVWPTAAPLASSFWLLSSSGNIWFFGYFPRIVDLLKYGVLTVLFPVESWLRQQVLQWSSNM